MFSEQFFCLKLDKEGGVVLLQLSLMVIQSIFSSNVLPDLQEANDTIKLGVVLTDGKSDDKTSAVASSLRANGIKMFAVAIGDEVDMTELETITNDESSIFQV